MKEQQLKTLKGIHCWTAHELTTYHIHWKFCFLSRTSYHLCNLEHMNMHFRLPGLSELGGPITAQAFHPTVKSHTLAQTFQLLQLVEGVGCMKHHMVLDTS